MSRALPKVTNSYYTVNINGVPEINYNKLSEARRYVKSLNVHEGIKSIQIIKITTTETILDDLKPTYEKVLSCDDFFSCD